MNSTTSNLAFLSGFGNHHQSEAVPGSLPIGQNSPQQVAHGLYAELFSGAAFTAPRANNLRTWLYRRQPSVVVGSYSPLSQPFWKTGLCQGEASPPNPIRWNPVAVPTEAEHPMDFIDGLHTLVVNGDAQMQTGIAAHVVLANRSMQCRALINADGEMLLLPQQGRLRITTELGVLQIGPGELALVPRGMAFKVALLDGPSRIYVAENYGMPFRLPELGPIGSNGLANPRDFLAPTAAFENEQAGYELVKRYGGQLWRADAAATPFNVVAWQPGTLPVRHPPFHDHRIDQSGPPRPVHLHRTHFSKRYARHGQL